tara:strand:- start:2899 stop:3330 length:432 start_codon:yes stop_codon:yes gene_type:complete
MIEETLWQIYQHSYFQSACRVIPCQTVTGHRAGAIISVWNPHGQNLTLAQNKRLERAAMRYLRAQGIAYKRLWGGNKDMSYRELSIFVPCSLQQAQHLSVHFKQLAFYYVSARGRVSLHCSKQTKPMCFVSKHLKKRWIASHA